MAAARFLFVFNAERARLARLYAIFNKKMPINIVALEHIISFVFDAGKPWQALFARR
jgi:hypothetical protein